MVQFVGGKKWEPSMGKLRKSISQANSEFSEEKKLLLLLLCFAI